MPLSTIINKLNEHGILDDLSYVSYNINNTKIFFGIPPIPIIGGLVYVFARHNNPQWKLIKSANGKGRFARNKDKSGIIEFGILDGIGSASLLQIFEAIAIPPPISVVDSSSGGTSYVSADTCVRVGTPEWRREAAQGVQVFTFETNELIISYGTRMVDI